ncbi:hypothetical protein GGR52DRAFT_248314 [Hypoxylon sp. FL1284]|nr:hypothetical protein GGR52DRAFT_248314 [Hypoxylon sp. FL1284]
MDLDDHVPAAELGLKPIHLACLEGDFETVVVLTAEDGAMNTLTEPQTGADWRLRETPIKLAALMGYLNIVEFLIERGAPLVHDSLRNDTHASLYAREDGLAEQRRDYYLRTIKIGRESLDAVNARKIIYGLLISPGRRSVLNAMRGPRADLGYTDYRLGKEGRHIVVYAPIHRIKTDIHLYRTKTIGIITSKGQGEVLMAAHSGFRLSGDDHDNKCLNTGQWNYIALHRIAGIIKFKFPGNLHDNSARAADDVQRGRAHAGHVEVLLASWYVLEMARRVTGRATASPRRNGKEPSLAWLLARLHRVRTATTLGAARTAVIMIDHQPCATCLKFINRLYQYTGVYFPVRGSVGIGPTLATKDPRTGLRLDTFGDVFPDEDGGGEDDDDDDEEDVEEVVPETPAAPRNMMRNRNTTPDPMMESPDHDAHAAADTPFPWMTGDPPRTPDPDSGGDADDVAHAARVVMEQIARAGPSTPLERLRTAAGWPTMANGRGRGDKTSKKNYHPFGDMPPSRRPANHGELLADYKKKTPVWRWPGYEEVAQRLRSGEALQRRLLSQGRDGTPCPDGRGEEESVRRLPGARVDGSTDGDVDIDLDVETGEGDDEGECAGVGTSDEDVILVDRPDDSDDAAAYSPYSNAGGGEPIVRPVSMAPPGINSGVREREEEEEVGDPSRSPLANYKVFLYSSFAPISSQGRGAGHADSSQLQAAMPPAPAPMLAPDFRMQIDGGGNGSSDADGEDDFYVVGPPSSQRNRADNNDDGGAMMEQDRDEEEAHEEVGMILTPLPARKPLPFHQWRYEPRSQHARLRNDKGRAPEAPMFQPRPIQNFRTLHRLRRS